MPNIIKTRYGGYSYSDFLIKEGDEDKDRLGHIYTAKQFSKLLTRFYNLNRSSSTLDIGCEWGYLVYFLRKKGIRAFGCDVEEKFIIQSPENIRKYLTHQYAENLDYPPASFDLITMVNVLEHIHEKELKSTLTKILSIMKEGGYLVIRVPDVKGGNPTHISIKHKSEWDKLFRSIEIENHVFAPNHLFFMLKKQNMINNTKIEKIVLRMIHNFLSNRFLYDALTKKTRLVEVTNWFCLKKVRKNKKI
jgi:2-polyprenyl-3-methyl-5-hydroxy-6-metoxy-1,4-benzoquinol methylase